MWCVPDLTIEFIERMEDLLRLYARKLDEREPVVCLDERPVVLHEDARRLVPMKSGRVARRDYEYVRCGTANVFCIVEPLTGKRLTFATADRKRAAYVRVEEDRSALPGSETHSPRARQLEYALAKSTTAILGSLEGRCLWRRFQVHYTPKHASWLNPAEIEASLVSSECLGRDRIPFLVELISRVSAWRRAAESAGRTIEWTFRVDDARQKFRYDGLITARSGD
jgi:DDE superfamily endonuclease